jgi:hypothetical protein
MRHYGRRLGIRLAAVYASTGSQARESNETPRLKAFCRVAPSVLLRAIFRAGVFSRASALRLRTSSMVHSRSL